MDFKKLKIKRELILPSLLQYSDDVQAEHTKKGNVDEYKITLPNQVPALLNVFCNEDGTTTLSYKFGKNQELSLAIANHIKENCTIGNNITKSYLTISNVTNDKFLLILEFLKEECNAAISGPILIQHGTQYKIKGVQGDSLTFNLYKTGKLQIQGKPLLLYCDLIDILSELFDYKEVINSQLKVIQVDIKVEEVLSDLKSMMPTAYGFIDNKLLSIISPALALMKIDVELSDYSCFAFPVLRGLEGYIKVLFSKKMKIVIEKNGFGEYFDDNQGKMELKKTIKSQHNLELCRAVENSYNYYRQQRHGLFHVDGIVETTRIIQSRKEATDIIEKAIEIMEGTYSSTIT